MAYRVAGGVLKTHMKRVWRMGLNVSKRVELLGVSLFRVIRFGKTQTYWEYRTVDTIPSLILELIKEYGMYRGIGFSGTV